MKLLITFILILFTLSSESKGKIILPIDSLTHKISFDTIILVPNKSKNVLQTELTEWIAKNYRSANDVIQMNDKESGLIILKGILSNVEFSGLGGGRDVFHTLTLKVKDGRIKIVITDMANDFGRNGLKNIEEEITENGWSSSLSPKQQMSFQISLKQRIDSLFKSIGEKLNSNGEDW